LDSLPNALQALDTWRTYQSFLDLVKKALSIVDSASKLLDTGLEKWRTHQKVAIGKDLFKVYFFAGRAEIR
jgi:hypothetical protein